MKTTTIKWLIGIVLLNIQIAAYSQNIINDNKEWAIVSTYSTKLENPYWTTYYKFMGDSIINGFSYHKLYKSTDSSQANWIFFSLWFERNDSVFILGQSCGYLDDTTTLIYNFNLQEGDTFPLYNNMRVDSIRYLYWGGSIRKHWFFNQPDFNPYGCITWVEGVGNLRNFNYSSICINSLSETLLCFQENGSLVYQNPNYTNCYVYTNAPSIKKSNELIILFPNPASTQLTFTIPENSTNVTYTLYNMQGIMQLTGKATDSQTEINVAILPRGLYLLKILTGNQTTIKMVILQ